MKKGGNSTMWYCVSTIACDYQIRKNLVGIGYVRWVTGTFTSCTVSCFLSSFQNLLF